jgi:hypothetical protein
MTRAVNEHVAGQDATDASQVDECRAGYFGTNVGGASGVDECRAGYSHAQRF